MLYGLVSCLSFQFFVGCYWSRSRRLGNADTHVVSSWQWSYFIYSGKMKYFLKSLTTSWATASLWDNVFWACNFWAASKFLNSFAPAVIVCTGVFAVHHNVVLWVHLVTWSGIINVTVETSGVTTASKRHAIHTAHLDKRDLWVQFIHNRNGRGMVT